MNYAALFAVMTQVIRRILLAAIAAGLLIAQPIAGAETLAAHVVWISEGDTLTVRDASRQRHRIRIAGIDAPENRQDFGRRSRQNLSRLTLERDVRLECHKSDSYGRKVCKVWVQPLDCSSCGQTLDVGLAQIVVGLAWWYREYAKEQTPEDRGRYESSEDEARLRHRGLWGNPHPTPPWEWRAHERDRKGVAP